MQRKNYVLITDVNSRKAFDVVNIIQRKLKYHVILAASKDFDIKLPLIYGCKVEMLRVDNIVNFKSDLLAITEKHSSCNLIYLPVSEKPTRFFLMLKENEEILSRWFSLTPSLQDFNLTTDKFLFQRFCEVHNHPVPKSYNENNFQELFTKFTPVVLKPKFGQGSVGIKYFYSKQDLPSVEWVDWDNNLIQEKIISKSNVAGAFFLMYNHQLISSYCHQRLRTFPESGGVTVYSKSVDYEEIIVLGKKLLGDLRWEGVAMIEFMFDESSGKWKIIELNPRLWGSVMLSEFCNSQILKFYIELALGNQESIDFQKSYVKTNLAIRWLYPLDIISFFKGRLPAKEFLNISPATTCYVNITYSSFYRTFAYFIYFTFNISSIARFFKKIKV